MKGALGRWEEGGGRRKGGGTGRKARNAGRAAGKEGTLTRSITRYEDMRYSIPTDLQPTANITM